jgi:C4-dicarboxylate transporter DctM subunit
VSNGAVVGLMVFCFLLLGFLGVPVPFAIIAGVIVGVLLTDVSMVAAVNQLFNGVNSVPLLAVPFFILIGELMASSNVTQRMISLAQALVGHIRSGLAQVITVFSIFFAGISGSSTADVAALSRVILPAMKKEGYNPANSAALIAAASTIANMIPPSIMAVIYGATGGVSIAALVVSGVVPGFMVGIGLMAYSYFFGHSGSVRARSSLGTMMGAARLSVLPLMIPIIIMGGILGGWFTPTEAGMVAVIYTIVVVIPLIARGHLRELHRDFMHAGVLYAITMMAVAGASAFAYLIAYLRGPQVVSGVIESIAGSNPVLIMFCLVIALIIAGNFIDAIPAIVIFMPIIKALVEQGDINPVHMGVVAIVTLAFGLLTPPYGLSLLLATRFAEVPFVQGLKKAIPIYAVFLVVISIIVVFPDLVLWLPRQLMPQAVGCFPAPDGGGFICP